MGGPVCARIRFSGKFEAGINRTLQKKHELLVRGGACVLQQGGESEEKCERLLSHVV